MTLINYPFLTNEERIKATCDSLHRGHPTTVFLRGVRADEPFFRGWVVSGLMEFHGRSFDEAQVIACGVVIRFEKAQ